MNEYQKRILEEMIYIMRKMKRDQAKDSLEQDANFIKEKAMELLKTLEKKPIE